MGKFLGFLKREKPSPILKAARKAPMRIMYKGNIYSKIPLAFSSLEASLVESRRNPDCIGFNHDGFWIMYKRENNLGVIHIR